MAMVSCRKAFTAKLLQNAKKNADIFAVATDSRGSVTLGDYLSIGYFEQEMDQGITTTCIEEIWPWNRRSASAPFRSFPCSPCCFRYPPPGIHKGSLPVSAL